MTTLQKCITVIAVVLGTALTRFLPFFLFPEGKTPPNIFPIWGAYCLMP